jgi:two-component system, cell cycle response regulator DivK
MAKKILVVDDDPNVVYYLVGFFHDNGYETCSAANAPEAFAVLQKEKPDLITLDIDMPEVTGPQFYRKYSTMDELKDVPVIVISGLAKPHLAIKKAIAVVEKPFDRDELLKIVKNAIGE